MEAWIKFLKPYGVAVCAGLLMAMVWPQSEAVKIVEASPIKNWTSNENITYTDLNNNFNHLHANLGHGHGPIVTANDIAPAAGIRPAQTTFGEINRRVAVGTWLKNPDAGTAYLPLNYTGTLALTVTLGSNSATITSAASGSVLPDGGTGIYTVFARGSANSQSDTSIVCADAIDPINTNAGINVTVACKKFSDMATAVPPYRLAVEVFYNGVQ